MIAVEFLVGNGAKNVRNTNLINTNILKQESTENDGNHPNFPKRNLVNGIVLIVRKELRDSSVNVEEDAGNGVGYAKNTKMNTDIRNMNHIIKKM